MSRVSSGISQQPARHLRRVQLQAHWQQSQQLAPKRTLTANQRPSIPPPRVRGGSFFSASPKVSPTVRIGQVQGRMQLQAHCICLTSAVRQRSGRTTTKATSVQGSATARAVAASPTPAPEVQAPWRTVSWTAVGIRQPGFSPFGQGSDS